ncbi:MAG TPA: DUF3859 domain-containing protein [Mariprofundaceae bacterium]|nr:DUF3859 domain-containing protein [Mariprofundaceae bacterium]
MNALRGIAATALFLVLASATADAAQSSAVPRVEVVDYGLYTASVVQSKRDAQGILDSVSSDIRHMKTTHDVPARLGTQFGLRFKLLGEPDGAQVTLKEVWIFPPAGLRPPEANEAIHQIQRNITVTMGKTRYLSYKFDDPWELIPGTWTHELWYQGRKVVSQRFTVGQP